MDNLFVVFILVVLGLISLAKKIAEQKQIEQAKKQQPARKTTMQDLPEETRRMIYGDAAPPVARPKGPPPRQARPAQPRPVPARRPAPPPRPVPQRRPSPPGAERTIEAHAPRSLAEHAEGQPVSPVAREAQRHAPQRPQPQRMPQQVMRRRPPERPPRPAPYVAVAVVGDEGEGVVEGEAPPVKRRRPENERPAAPQAAKPRAPMAPAAAMARRMFANPQSLRHAIIAAEILGPPKGMQY